MAILNDKGQSPYSRIVLDNATSAAGDTPLQLSFVGEGTTGIGHPAANAVSIVTAGVEVARASKSTFSVSGFFAQGVASSVAAGGTTFASATPLTAATNFISPAVTANGIVLPSSTAVPTGTIVSVYNQGAGVIRVYAQGADTIDGTAGATGVVLTNAKRCQYQVQGPNSWVSAQFGVVSG